MLIPLPDLDDRRWIDLVEESRALIPVLAPDWTDHNVSDPGVTLIELFAWFTEMDVYRVNQVSAAARLRFLALVGVVPQPATPARTVVRFMLAEGVSALDLPRGTEVEGRDPMGSTTRFRTLDPVTVLAARLSAVYSIVDDRAEDLTLRRDRGETILPFGADPAPGAALYLGFSTPLPVGVEASVYVSVGGPVAGAEERARLIAEEAPRRECLPATPLCGCEDHDATRTEEQTPTVIGADDEAVVPEHHAARLSWEFRTSGGSWQPLVAAADEVRDDTRSLTLSGRVVLRLPAAMGHGADQGVDSSLFYVRCRFVDGAFDAAPGIDDVSLNAVAAEQAVSPDVADARVVALPPGREGVGELLGTGTGRPLQEVSTSDRHVVEESLLVETIEGTERHVWHRRQDFDSSARADRHYVLDPVLGSIRFGDGDRGRTVREGARIVVSYRVTRAESGDLPVGRVDTLSPTRHNHSAFPFDAAVTALASIANATPAAGGAAAETAAGAAGRALDATAGSTRAVTLTDYERLARETPGVRVARASAIAGLHPAFPCVDAAGLVTVLVIPWLPATRPMPSPGLLRAVRAYLSRRRLVGTRVEVMGPTYTEVAVRASVTARSDQERAMVESRVVAAIRQFFSPTDGGPDRTGWPFGRDVYRAEVMHVIGQVDGVVRVDSVALVADGCGPDCGNICIGATGLVSSGKHEITVR